MGVAERPSHQERHAQDELALGEVLRRPLVRGVHRRAGGHRGAVDEADVAQHEHPLPRHQHVVEEGDAVHLLEARAERMVEVRASEVEALSTQEAQARRAARNREVDGERAVRLRQLREAG